MNTTNDYFIYKSDYRCCVLKMYVFTSYRTITNSKVFRAHFEQDDSKALAKRPVILSNIHARFVGSFGHPIKAAFQHLLDECWTKCWIAWQELKAHLRTENSNTCLRYSERFRPLYHYSSFQKVRQHKTCVPHTIE